MRRRRGTPTSGLAIGSGIAALLFPASALGQSVDFSEQRLPTNQFNPVAITSADFLNVLPNDDIAVASAYADPGQPFYMSVFTAASNGTLGTATLYPSGPSASTAITPGEFGNPDSLGAGVAITNGPSDTVTVQLNPFDFSPRSYTVGDQPAGVTAADMTADDADDLLVANAGSDDLAFLANADNGEFLPATYVDLSPIGSRPGPITSTDFDGDGNYDAMVALESPPRVVLLLGHSGDAPSISGFWDVGSQPSGVGAGDFNGDGLTDIAVSNEGDSSITILLNANGGFTSSELPSLAQPQGITVDDFNGDGNDDLAVATLATEGPSNNNIVSVLLSKGDGTFTSLSLNHFEVGSFPVAIASGRLRGPHALPDLFTANFNTNDISVLTNTTASCRGKPATFVGTAGADRLRGTRRRDVIVARRGDDRIKALRGHDLVCAGAGNDRLVGGRGDDHLRGGPGADLIKGGRGDDLLHGNQGRRDDCRGGRGNDRLRACE